MSHIPKVPKDFSGWMHQFELDYLKDNHVIIQDAMDHLSFLPDDCHMRIGGIMHALSLDNDQRIKMANLWGKSPTNAGLYYKSILGEAHSLLLTFRFAQSLFRK